MTTPRNRAPRPAPQNRCHPRLLTPLAAALSLALVTSAAQAQDFMGDFTPLGDLPGGGVLSVATGVNSDGLVVVGQSASASGNEAFRWTQVDSMVGLGDLAGGVFSSSANGVNSDGSVVVGRGISASGSEAFRWTQVGGMVGLGDLPGGVFFSSANDG